MTDKPGTSGLTFNERLSQNNQSGLNQMKYSVIVPGTKPPVQGGLSFSNQRQDMSKSVIQREPTQDIQSFIREVKMKFLKVEQALSEHDTQLKELRSDKFFSSYSMNTSPSTDSFSMDIARGLRNDCDNNVSKLRTIMYQQIDRIRAQIGESFVRKNDLDFSLSKIQTKIIETVKNNNNAREISQLKQKINFECRSLFERITQDLVPKINTNNDQARSKLTELEQQVGQLRRKLDTLKQETKPSVFTSNQKFYSPRLVKYKEIIQKLPANSYDKPGEQITINEVTYYLDKQGRLLDSTHHYLVDKNNKQIQLDYKQLTILNVHEMLN